MGSSKQMLGFLAGLFSLVMPAVGSSIGLLNSFGMQVGCYVFAIVLAILGIILSASSIKQVRAEGVGEGLSIAGIILSIIGIVSNIGMLIIFVGAYTYIESYMNK